MKTKCPFCNGLFDVDDEFAGQKVNCSSCGKEFVITRNCQPVLKPVDTQQSKDILLFWIMYPVFYFLLLVLIISPAINGWYAFFTIALTSISLASGVEFVVKAELGINNKSLLYKWRLLLFFVMPVGFIMYADERKKRGLSNIMPWATITSIIIGLTIFVAVGMAIS